MQNIFSKEANAISRRYRLILVKVGATAVNFSKERFILGNWVDRTRQPWKARKVEDKGEKRAILVSSGQLKKSIRVVRISGNRITIGTDVKYAKIHNEGGVINNNVSVRQHNRRTKSGKLAKVKGHKRKMNIKMEKRQFLGPSAILERRIERVLDKEIKDALKNI